jgi:hypothetical protein
MRFVLLLLFTATSAFSQITFGIKAGVPITDFFDTVTSPRFGFNSNTKRYIIGPTAELRLPFGLSVELDALYRRMNYEGSGTLVDIFTNNRTTGNAWEFPLLLKYRAPTGIARPYVAAGVAFDTLTGLRQTITQAASTIIRDEPVELRKKTTTGFVIGAGLDVHAILIHISPEIRYTRWGSEHFADTNGLLRSNRNQAEFLVGFTF